MIGNRPLYIYGKPNMSRIKDAKLSMNLDYLVQPIILVDDNWDNWSSWARVLAWGAKPYHPCDYAQVTDKTSTDGLVAALKWVLSNGSDPRAFSTAHWLEEFFGEVRELTKKEKDAYNRERAFKEIGRRLKLYEPGDSRDGR